MTTLINSLRRTIASLIAIISIGFLTACGGGGAGLAGPSTIDQNRAQAPAYTPDQGSEIQDPRDAGDDDGPVDEVLASEPQ